MADNEPMKCAFAKVLNDLAPGKYHITLPYHVESDRLSTAVQEACAKRDANHK